MKGTHLKKQIIRHFAISLALALIASIFIYYRLHQEQKSNDVIHVIELETLDIQNKTADLESKIGEVKKYKEIFKTISENRKNTNGIRIDDINSRLEEIGNRHNISDSTIKVSFPEPLLEGIFNMSTIEMVFSSVDLSFKAINDTEALLFISNLTNSLPGYVVINKLSISKSRDYSDADLVSISSGQKIRLITAQVNFYWYVYKPKTEKKPDSTNEQIKPEF